MPFDSHTASEAGKKSKRGPAKLTSDVKEAISLLVDDLQKDLATNLNKLEPREKADLLVKLLEYVIPKQRANSNTFIGEAGEVNSDPLAVFRKALNSDHE